MTEDGTDFTVDRIALNGLSIDAGRHMGMILVQSEYDLVLDGTVPFRIAEASRAAQRELIEKAFQIRVAEKQERNVPVSFILFPEAAIPVGDPDGLDCLRQQLEQAQGDIIFIGGLEGLSPREAQELPNRFGAGLVAAGPTFADGTFVNVCVIAVKSAHGLSWHFQAKLRPSQWEQQRNMARGQRVLHFVAPQIAFLCQICFDHIAADGNASLNAALFQQLIDRSTPNAAPLDFVFVPQFNPKPLDSAMRSNTCHLLNYSDRALKNEMAAVIVINKAARAQESSSFGRCGFHYKSGRWQIPDLDVGPKAYELHDLNGVTSAVFRKRTPSIHVTTVVPASHNVGNSGNPRRPLDNARSYLLNDIIDYGPPFLSGIQPSVCTVGRFVEYNCLPCKLGDALYPSLPSSDTKRRWQGSDASQSQLLTHKFTEIRQALLVLGCDRVKQVIDLLLSMHDEKARANPDLWSKLQIEAVIDLCAALCVLGEWSAVDFDTAAQWTALLGESLAVCILDGEDDRRDWSQMQDEYLRTFESQYYRPEFRTRPVLLVALRSRGLVQPLVRLASENITSPVDRTRFGSQDSIAEPRRLRLYVCQDAIFHGARQAGTIATFLEAEMRCVLE